MKNVLPEEKILNFEINGILWKIRDYVACHKNVRNILLT